MRAFSMVEILVVFAILSLVAATLLPVLQSSKLKALRVTDVSNLRQLGQARELYASDNDSVEILQTWQLKRGGYVVAKTLQSPLDQTSYGIGNCLWRYQHSQLVAPIVPWKDSYPSIRDGNGGIYIRGYLLAQPTVGWLVSPANGAFAPLQDPKSCLVDSSTGEFFSGSYLRLGLDGRIMTKHRARSDSIRADEMFVDNPDLTWNATH